MLTVGDSFPLSICPSSRARPCCLAARRSILARPSGKWKVLFYWPKDFTFVCPTEIVGYGELKADFTDRDAELIGASTDTAHVHFAWRRSERAAGGC